MLRSQWRPQPRLGASYLGVLIFSPAGEFVCPSNDMRISCGRSWFRPNNPTFHSALQEGAARAEAGARSGPSAACAG